MASVHAIDHSGGIATRITVVEADRLDFEVEVEPFDRIVDFLRDGLAGTQRSSYRTIYLSHVVFLIFRCLT